MEIQIAKPVLTAIGIDSTNRAVATPRADVSEMPHKAAGDCHDGSCTRQDYALGALRQELRASLRADVRAAPDNAYTAHRNSQSADDIADETLVTARQAVAENPADATRIVVAIRSRVHEVAQYVQRQVAPTGHSDDVDSVIANVDSGLDEMESAASLNREASTRALDVDLRSRQRSTIRIKTQEGDIVRFDLRQMNRTSINHESVTNDNGMYSTTEVDVSARTRMLLRVDGDLSEAEMSAIQSVFDQAEAIASEFFDGDMAAALSLVSNMEFDGAQLERVRLGFRSHQVSHVAYSSSVQQLAAVPVERAPEHPASVEQAAGSPVAPVTPEVPAATEVAEPAESTSTAVADDPIAQVEATGFFAAISAFLRATSDGFTDGASGMKFRLHFSESFKLDLLKAVIHTTAPEKSDSAAEGAVALVDSVSVSQEADD
ncbi:MAG: hypothetical protein QNJ14_08775 [Woeseiaceae bacterium]|nr:hypothetical protein [Woeseiaceae bacterium]